MALGVFTSSFATTSVGGLFMTSGVLIGVGESIMFSEYPSHREKSLRSSANHSVL